VLEETYPVIELQFSDRRQTMGRYSGHVPSEGELTPDLVERIIVTQSGLTSEPLEQPQIKPRRPSLCPGCPHRSSFFAVKQVFGDAIYASDIGCYTLGINMAAVDTCLCMGASVGMAQGLAGRGQSGKVVATIGDSTFFHAGIPALINAAHTGSRFVLVVLDNAITAMTGGQPTPASSVLVDGAPARPVSLEKIIAACGVDFLEVVDPRNQESALDALQRADKYTYEERRGVSALIMRAPCVQSVKPTREHLYAVGDECDRCMTCIRDLECPAISFDREAKRARIDQDMCAGCGTCAQVCPSHAILPGGAS
jgi:indolepyruvate ferredoxin oxidoreductase alpha subunit